MNFSKSSLGPRGWALVVILLGTFISVPFVRSSDERRVEQGFDRPGTRLNDSAHGGRIRLRQFPEDDQYVSTELERENASLPEWARRPSQLDSLIQQSKQGIKLSHKPSPLPERKPAPHKAWTSQAPETSLAVADEALDLRLSSNRTTPFSESSESGLISRQSSLAELVWPDVALGNQLAKNRSNGSILAASSRAGDSPGAVLKSRESSIDELPNARWIEKKEFSPEQERGRPIGAQLRRGLTPNDARFIFQPGISQ